VLFRDGGPVPRPRREREGEGGVLYYVRAHAEDFVFLAARLAEARASDYETLTQDEKLMDFLKSHLSWDDVAKSVAELIFSTQRDSYFAEVMLTRYRSHQARNFLVGCNVASWRLILRRTLSERDPRSAREAAHGIAVKVIRPKLHNTAEMFGRDRLNRSRCEAVLTRYAFHACWPR